MRFRLTREEKKSIIDFLENFCRSTRFSPKTLGIMFRSFHYNTPIVSLYNIIFKNDYLVMITLFILFLAYTSWIPFNGCFLSMLENRVCNDDFNIADPFLELVNFEKSKKNRIYISYFMGGSYLFLILLILLFRYYLYDKLKNL